MRTELRTARDDNRRLIEVNRTYATIINQLADDLATVTTERDVLLGTPTVARLRRRAPGA